MHAKPTLVRTVDMLGLADTDFMLSEAVSCEVMVKLERWYCGTASHVHVLDVPHETQVEIGVEECRSVFHFGKYQYNGRFFFCECGFKNES